MSGFLPPVIAVLGASIGEFSAKMGEARAEMRTTESSFAEAGALGKGALLGIGAVAVGVGYESVKMASGFDQAMEMVHTQAGASQQEVDKLKGSVLALAPAVGMGPEELATGLYHIESAGFRGSQAMDILAAASKLAVIGQSDFETTSQAVVGVMASQIKGVKDAADAGNLLNTTVGMGDMKMQALAEAIGTGILPKAAAAGLSFEDVGSALATLTDNVTPANEAATRLGMTFSMMSAPTAKAKTAYEQIGMASNQLANDMRSKGLFGALEDLKSHLDKTYPPSQKMKLSLQEQSQQLKTYSDSLTSMGVPVAQQTTLLAQFKKQLESGGSAAVKQSEALSAMFGGGKSSGTMMTLLGEMDRFKEKTQQYGTAASRAKQAQEAWSAQQKQFSQQIKEIGAQFEVWGVKLGNVLIPYLQKFIGWVETGAKWLGKHKDVLVVLAGVLTGLVVPAIYSMGAAFLSTAAEMLTNPVFLVIAAIAAAAYLVITHWKQVKGFFEDLWKWMKDAAGAVAHFFEHVWDDVAGAFKRVWGTIKGALKLEWAGLQRVWDDTGGKLVHWIAQTWEKLTAPVVKEWKTIAGDLSSIWQSLTTIWNATGGKLVTLISDHLQAVEDAFTTIWDGIVDYLRFAWDTVSGLFRAAFQVVSGIVRGGWDVVRGIFQASWDLVKGLVKAGWDIVSGAFRAAFDLVAGIVTAGWDVVKGIFKAAWDLITGILNAALDVIKGVLKLFADLVTGKWGKLWGDVKNLFTSVWNDIKGIFTGVLGAIKNTVVGGAKAIWDGFTGAIKNALGAVGNALHAVGNAVTGAFKDAGKWLWDAGKAIIGGLVNGVKSVIGDVKNTLVGLGKDIIGWKGPPAKDAVMLRPAGQLLMQGLIGGIDSKTGDLKGKLTNVSRTISGGIGGGLNMSGTGIGGGVSSGGGVIVVVNVAGAVHSDQGIAKVVREQVLRYNQRNSSNNLALTTFGR